LSADPRLRRRSVTRLLAGIAVIALAIFAALTIAVSAGGQLAIDRVAFDLADDLRAPWLDHAARIVTTLGLFAIVGPVVLLCAAFLIRRGRAALAVALVAGVGLEWLATTITKAAVDRPRPPSPLVHTSGASYPSGHAANSIGWLALALALSVVIPTRRARIATIAGGAILAALVGATRVYLRAHYASDVLAGELLAVAIYAITAICAFSWDARKHRGARGSTPA
jgi:undecaprenyl-diphosphatase